MTEFWVFIIAGALVIMNILLGGIASALSDISKNGEKTAKALTLLAEIANIKRGA